PLRWETGTAPEPINWYAGMQYDGDIARAKQVLSELKTYYPGATQYEIAGFFFWQGDKDRYDPGHASRYEQNLVHLIRQLRRDFNAPHAKFVCATLGQTEKGAEGVDGQILQAQLAVDGETGRYPEFQGNVATIYSFPLSQGGASNGHYNGNAETYMNVGEAMGRAMATLQK
ncbi:MAG: sialate O-acetylesterase, partial [Planctomycetaceae bacterium]|nr:sialate O-acetylesterase [Planctomycetaceae bacterium]